MKKIQEILNKFKDLNPKELEIFISEILDKDKSFIITHPEYPISNIQYLRLCWFIYRYNQGYSVAAITGHKEFYGLDFFVNRHVLIPRPDTELMVTEAIEEIKNPTPCPSPNRGGIKGGVVLIDVGTGSGCIPISTIKTLAHKNINTIATDISRAALRVAKKNARKHKVNIKFLRGNLLEPILSVIPAASGNPDNSTGHWIPNQVGNDNRVIITANLPYLTEKQFQSEPSIQREPKKALVAKNNGLALYEELLKQIARFKIYNLKFIILFEIDPSQTEEISKLIKQYLPESNFKIKKDLAGRDRLVKIIS